MLFRLAWPESYTIVTITPVIDMRDIDQSHVAPNMGNFLKCCIWYPPGQEHISI
jgi:hypothetical protein